MSCNLDIERIKICLALSQVYVPFMRNMHKIFNGDLTMAMIVGEIAQYNAEAKCEKFAGRPELTRGCNVHSLSHATGIPKETVRRKVAKLRKDGLLMDDADGNYYCTATLTATFLEYAVPRGRAVAADAKTLERLLAEYDAKNP